MARGYGVVDWLYAVDMPVDAQSVEERERVARAGLLRVLTRVTGLKSVPRNAVVAEALDRPDRFYSEFVFFNQTDVAGLERLHLRVVFQRDAILSLVDDAQLPVWWNRRPEILAWIVVEENLDRHIPGDDSLEPVVASLRDAARRRGVILTLPLMDLDDALTITPGDLWSRGRRTLEQASARYTPDVILTGRLRRNMLSGTVRYTGDWEVAQLDLNLEVPVDLAPAETAAVAGMDAVVDRLVERFAVLPRGEQVQTLSISGIDSPGGYAGLMTYLRNLEFILDISVLGVQDNLLAVDVVTHASHKQLFELLTSEGLLTRSGQLTPALHWQAGAAGGATR